MTYLFYSWQFVPLNPIDLFCPAPTHVPLAIMFLLCVREPALFCYISLLLLLDPTC